MYSYFVSHSRGLPFNCLNVTLLNIQGHCQRQLSASEPLKDSALLPDDSKRMESWRKLCPIALSLSLSQYAIRMRSIFHMSFPQRANSIQRMSKQVAHDPISGHALCIAAVELQAQI